jgi:diguanylate cyclase (GGDEF)-like protein
MALAALLIAVVVVEAATSVDNHLGGGVAKGADASVGLLCALVCLSRARRAGDDNAGWLLIGLGIAAWALGNAYFTLSGGGLPVPSLADALWLSFYPLIFGGVLVLGRHRMLHLGPALWLDGLIAALACAALCAAFVLDAVLSAVAGQPLLTTTINVAYPIGDMLLIVLLFGLIMTGPVHWRRGLIAATLGLIVFAVSDTLYLVRSAEGLYNVGELLDAGWLVGLMLVAYASMTWTPLPEQNAERARLGAPLGATAVSGAIALGVLAFGGAIGHNPLATMLAASALVLVLVRLLLAMAGNREMLEELRCEAITDALTGLGNRRRLYDDLPHALSDASEERPIAVMIFDLDGFKTYNDSFGHAAGDRLLERIAHHLQIGVTGTGFAYRLGGDEFCAIVETSGRDPQQVAADLAASVGQRGLGFTVTASHGCATAPADGGDSHSLMRIADRRMYERKNERRPSAASQATDALLALVHERYPQLDDHTSGVASLATRVAKRLGLGDQELDAITCAAALHDVGKIAIPDSILHKPGPLDDGEWELMRRHTEIGERVLRAVPALRKAAPLVRWSHERWDGGGYPDALTGTQIPIGAAIVAACDSYDAMTEDRSYQQAKSRDEALAELRRCAGSQFRPDVVDALCAVLQDQPSVVVHSASNGKAPMAIRPSVAMFGQ